MENLLKDINNKEHRTKCAQATTEFFDSIRPQLCEWVGKMASFFDLCIETSVISSSLVSSAIDSMKKSLTEGSLRIERLTGSAKKSTMTDDEIIVATLLGTYFESLFSILTSTDIITSDRLNTLVSEALKAGSIEDWVKEKMNEASTEYAN